MHVGYVFTSSYPIFSTILIITLSCIMFSSIFMCSFWKLSELRVLIEMFKHRLFFQALMLASIWAASHLNQSQRLRRTMESVVN